jgi:Tfp pilus assembly protein PilE
MSRLLQWVRRRGPAGDQGTTLMELMMGMVIMTILMTICTTAIVSMFSGTGKTQAVQNSAQQLNTAFIRLDDQVRYASAIDQPTGSATAGNLSVLFLTVTSASSTCTQLKIQPVPGSTQQQLVERSWPLSSTSSAGAWNQLAGGVTIYDQNGATITPFTVSTPAGGTVQQLRLRLIALDSTGQTPTKSFSEVVFSALNSAATVQAVKNGTYQSACSQTVTS